MEIYSIILTLLESEGVILRIIFGGLFGICLGLTGVGGGVLLIPILQLFCDMSPVLAVGTASMISTFVKINASILHIKSRNVSWRHISMLFVSAVPITILVTQVVVYFNEHALYSEQTQTVISYLVLIVMIGSLISVFRKYRKSTSELTGYNKAKSASNNKVIVSGMFCGSVLGSTGVGGGVLLLPILNDVINLDIKKAIGSSVVLALCLSAITAIGYAKGGQADISTAVLFLIGSFVGVPIASKLMKHLSNNSVYIITLSVIAASLAMFISTF